MMQYAETMYETTIANEPIADKGLSLTFWHVGAGLDRRPGPILLELLVEDAALTKVLHAIDCVGSIAGAFPHGSCAVSKDLGGSGWSVVEVTVSLVAAHALSGRLKLLGFRQRLG